MLPTAGLPAALADGFDRKLVSIFEHARVLRNKSGHPTGEDVSQKEAQAGLLLFPRCSSTRSKNICADEQLLWPRQIR